MTTTEQAHRYPPRGAYGMPAGYIGVRTPHREYCVRCAVARFAADGAGEHATPFDAVCAARDEHGNQLEPITVLATPRVWQDGTRDPLWCWDCLTDLAA